MHMHTHSHEKRIIIKQTNMKAVHLAGTDEVPLQLIYFPKNLYLDRCSTPLMSRFFDFWTHSSAEIYIYIYLIKMMRFHQWSRMLMENNL